MAKIEVRFTSRQLLRAVLGELAKEWLLDQSQWRYTNFGKDEHSLPTPIPTGAQCILVGGITDPDEEIVVTWGGADKPFEEVYRQEFNDVGGDIVSFRLVGQNIPRSIAPYEANIRVKGARFATSVALAGVEIPSLSKQHNEEAISNPDADV